MLTPPPAAVTATTNEFESAFGNAATPSNGVVLASAGAKGTHGDGSIEIQNNRKSFRKRREPAVPLERKEKSAKSAKKLAFFFF